MMFDFLRKKNNIPVKKSHASNIQPFIFTQSFDNFNQSKITPARALFYYDTAAPVSTSIDMINDEFKNLDLAVSNTTDNEVSVTRDDDILNFLKQPNDDMVLVDFLETLGAFFLITNEVYIIATGAPGRPPSELFVISPKLVEVRRNSDGLIDQITVQNTHGSRWMFLRDEREFRFFTKDQQQEIWQIKGFNTEQIGRGYSKLSSISKEIDQYIQTSIHNLALLRNGLKASGAFVTDDPLADDQFERLKEQLENFYSGSENAAKSLILDNGLKFGELGINPKDMDFLNLKRDITKTIFNRYKIPQALMGQETSSLGSMGTAMEQATLQLYDNAVLPFAKRMLAELTKFLAPRFKLSENQLIVPFMDSITALQSRRNAQLKLKKDIQVNTINELRLDMGQEVLPKDQGGDIVHITNNLVPSGTKPPDDNPPDNPPPNPNEEERAKSSRSNFAKILKSQMDVNGNRTFTDKIIDDMADEEGL